MTQAKGRESMPAPLEKAADYLQKLEADRLAAIAESEGKAAEAKLIEARQEGFRKAMDMLGIEPAPILTEPAHSRPSRRKYRNIPGLILTELSFTGNAMTTRQIAAAIDYLPERTEKALQTMESSGQIIRDRDGRWTMLVTTPPHHDNNATPTANGKSSIENGLHGEVSRLQD
jgi:hypothetical protein